MEVQDCSSFCTSKTDMKMREENVSIQNEALKETKILEKLAYIYFAFTLHATSSCRPNRRKKN